MLGRKEFIIEHLRREWDDMERSARREDVVRAVKAGGAALGKGLLVLLLIAGALTVAAVAPNVFSAFGRFRGRKIRKVYFNRDQFRREIAPLKRLGHIRVRKDAEGEYEIDLTKLGEKVVIQRAFGQLKIPKPDHWDGIWRMTIFDIPDRHKTAREGFRERLKAMGFYPLQESVFVFPYPCDEEIRFLIYVYNAGAYVRLVETSKIIYDDDLRKHFALK